MSARKNEQIPSKFTNSSNATQTLRLWAPWRMKYIAHETGEGGCIFCNRLASEDDTRSLILRRADHAFVIMNLYPYNTGHVMIVPNQHVADPAELTPQETGALANLLPDTLAALRRVLDPAGFNVGMNIGAVAGAGVADHVHQHVVPRWHGDANFMPIIAGVMVIPELIPATYAKVRAELERSHQPAKKHAIALVVLNCKGAKVLVTSQNSLPTVDVGPSEVISARAAEHIRTMGIEAELAGWAGNQSTKTFGRAAFAFLASEATKRGDELRWLSHKDAATSLRTAEDRRALRNALSLDRSLAVGPSGKG